MQSNDHKDYDDKLYFNFYVSDMNGYFGNNWDPSTGVYVSVDQYRDGERIRESQSVVMWNSSNSNPSVGDGHGRVDPYNATALAFETGDFLCLFPGKTDNETANIRFIQDFEILLPFLFEFDFDVLLFKRRDDDTDTSEQQRSWIFSVCKHKSKQCHR